MEDNCFPSFNLEVSNRDQILLFERGCSVGERHWNGEPGGEFRHKEIGRLQKRFLQNQKNQPWSQQSDSGTEWQGTRSTHLQPHYILWEGNQLRVSCGNTGRRNPVCVCTLLIWRYKWTGFQTRNYRKNFQSSQGWHLRIQKTTSQTNSHYTHADQSVHNLWTCCLPTDPYNLVVRLQS